ncbi:MAG: TRAP transporter substrate-binding protein DctP [Desulfomonile tiedjei]|nr:TRAP transporter substrate-binding protein DctP [Desulfomonile tiedjei]
MLKKAATVLVATLVLCLCPLVQVFAQTTLSFQCAYPEKANVGQSTSFFASEVARLTNNQVQVKITWPGQGLKITEVFDAVCQGKLDGYSGSLLYYADKVPEVNCQWLPFNWANAADAKDVLLNKGYCQVMADAVAKHGVTYLGALSVSSMGLLTKFPVTKIGDLKGKKIRAVGMEAEIIEALGASAIDIPAPEQHKALKDGVVDGTDFPWYTVEQYKFYEVLSHIVKPALHTPGIIEITINTKTFKALPNDQQQALQKAAMSAMERSFAQSDGIDQAALEKAEKLGVTVSVIPEFQLVKFRGATRSLWNAEAKKSQYSAKLVEILRDHLKKSMGIEQ